MKKKESKKDFYFYPMILIEQEDGYGVIFPDFQGCVSHGKDIEDAIKSGKEALSLHIYGMLEDNDEIPEASEEIKLADGQILIYADINMKLFSFSFKSKSVTRAITLPQYLNELAKESGMNVSLVAQEAIKEYLGIED